MNIPLALLAVAICFIVSHATESPTSYPTSMPSTFLSSENLNVVTAINRAAASANVDEIANAINALGVEAAKDKNLGYTALSTTIYFGNLDVVKLLHSKLLVGINDVGSFGNTGLMWAAMWGKANIVEYYMEHDALRDVKNVEGKTAEDLAAENGHASIVVALQNYRPDN